MELLGQPQYEIPVVVWRINAEWTLFEEGTRYQITRCLYEAGAREEGSSVEQVVIEGLGVVSR